MTEERIITAAVVTLAEKGDRPELAKILEISQENGIYGDSIMTMEPIHEMKISNSQVRKILRW